MMMMMMLPIFAAAMPRVTPLPAYVDARLLLRAAAAATLHAADAAATLHTYAACAVDARRTRRLLRFAPMLLRDVALI